MEQWGVRIPQQARLWSHEKRVKAALEADPPETSAQFINQLSFDLREVDEIIEIISSFSPTPNREELAKLQAIAKGTEHPDAETNTTARNTQYELYLFSIFNKAGIRTRIGEPDLLMQAGGQEYPVAAKRPYSENGFDRLLHKAVRQLVSFSNPGIVAISLDQVARPRRHNLRVACIEELNTVTQDCLDLFTFEHHSQITNRVRDRNVAGVFYTMKIPGFITSTGTICLTSHAHFECFLPKDHPAYEVVHMFAALIDRMTQSHNRITAF